jgi:hypothetical protein
VSLFVKMVQEKGYLKQLDMPIRKTNIDYKFIEKERKNQELQHIPSFKFIPTIKGYAQCKEFE